MSGVFTKAKGENQLDAANTATLQALIEILRDKVQQIVTKSYEAVSKYQSEFSSNQIALKSDQPKFEQMMTYLLERSMDKRVEQKTRETYAKFYGISQLE